MCVNSLIIVSDKVEEKVEEIDELKDKLNQTDQNLLINSIVL